MIDFSECEFIHDEMTIYTFEDFYKDRKLIKQQYEKLTKNGKRFYMWYLYSNIHMGLNKKNAIWDYLNDYKDDEQLLEVKNEGKWKN